MPWTYDDDNVLTRLIYPYFGSQERAATALGLSGPTLMRRRNLEHPLTAEEAVSVEELTDGEIDRCDIRPDLWPAERWKRLRKRRASA